MVFQATCRVNVFVETSGAVLHHFEGLLKCYQVNWQKNLVQSDVSAVGWQAGQLGFETARESIWVNLPVNQEQIIQTIEFGDVLIILLLLQNLPLIVVMRHGLLLLTLFTLGCLIQDGLLQILSRRHQHVLEPLAEQ